MNFESFGLDPRILAGVTAAGYTTPTPIQQQAIPVVLEGKDILGLAQTGTGKTAAFALPILQHLTKSQTQSRKPRVLVVAPTRELAEQIHESFEEYGKKIRARSVTIYGGVGKTAQINELRKGTDIVVACPGRLLDHIGDRNIDLSGIEILVLDEADRMCDMGFLPDIRRILATLPRQRQTLFFSATMPADIRQLSRDILTDPVTVQIGQIAPAETVEHALYPVTDGLKTKLLFAMLERTATGRVLVFTRTKRRARFLAADLEARKYRVAALQGNMAQNRRQEAINGFKAGKYDILVATDIAARGIDVTEISHVINYDMPDTTDAYTHRIGRTGRAEQSGDAFTFATPADSDMVRDIERVLGKKIDRRRLEGFDYAGFSPESLTSSGGNQPARSNQSGRNGQNNSHRQPQPQQRNAQVSNQRNGNRPADSRQSSQGAAVSSQQRSRPEQSRPARAEQPMAQERANRSSEGRPQGQRAQSQQPRTNRNSNGRNANDQSLASRSTGNRSESSRSSGERTSAPSPRQEQRPIELKRSLFDEQANDASNSGGRRRIWRKRSAA